MPTLSPKSSPQPLRVRKCSDSQGDADRSSGPVPPLPPVGRNYTAEDIQDRLAYADRALCVPKRKLSPIGTRALRIYEDVCVRLLDLEEGEIGEEGEEGLKAMKNEWKSTLRTYDQAMQYTACLAVTHSADVQELQDQLVMLRKTAFYTRHGDIFAEVYKSLKTEAESKKVDGWQML